MSHASATPALRSPNGAIARKLRCGAVLGALLLTVWAGGALAATEEAGADAKALEGKWSAVTYVEDGEAADTLERTPIWWEFKGGQVIITAKDRDEHVLKGGFKLNAKPAPAELELRFDAVEGGKEQVAMGIYEVKQDKLRICYTLAGAKRPTRFESTEGSKAVLIGLTRVKPAADIGHECPPDFRRRLATALRLVLERGKE